MGFGKACIKLRHLEFCRNAYVYAAANGWYDTGTGIFVCSPGEIGLICQVVDARF